MATSLEDRNKQGSAECSGGYGGGRWYNDDDYSSDTYEMEEVFDTSLTAEHWIDEDGQRLELAPMIVKEAEVISDGALTDVDPEEDFEGYTGNAGMTLERWYRHAAIFLWPEKRHFQILCDCGTTSAVTALSYLVEKWAKTSSDEKHALKEKSLEFSAQIIEHWNAPTFFEVRDEPKPCLFASIIELLESEVLLQRFLAKVVSQDGSVEVSHGLLELCEKFGWNKFREAFDNVFSQTSAASLARNVRLLEQLSCCELQKNKTCRDLIGVLAPQLVSGLAEVDRKKTENWAPKINRPSVLAGLVRALIVAKQPEPLSKLIDSHIVHSTEISASKCIS